MNTLIPSKVWIVDRWVTFSLSIGNYQNIITFLDDNGLSFLTLLTLDFTQIPLFLHGKGNSTNLLEYLSNNSDDNIIINQFLNYFLNTIISMSYSSGQKMNFNINDDAGWQNMAFNVYSPYIPPTTTTTTIAPTTTTTTTDTPTTTTTTTVLGISITFDNISNANLVISGDSSSVSDWNLFFDLPTNGTEFSSLEISNNTVNLFGGSNIHLKDSLFDNEYSQSLISIEDNSNCVVSAGAYSFGFNNFSGATNLTTVSLPSLTICGEGCFYYCISLINVNLPLLTICGDSCFNSCFSLTNINLSSLEFAGIMCFSQCYMVSYFDFPKLKNIDTECFIDCSSAQYFNLPELTGVTGNNNFCYCQSAVTFNLPLLTNVSDGCFNRCISLTGLTLPSVTMIENGGGIINCSKLVEINLPLATYIGDTAFVNNIVLSKINIPSCTSLGSTTLNNNVFNNISGLTIDLTIPSALMTCNTGGPDGDIEYLQSNNTINIIYSDASTTTTTTTDTPTTTTTTT